MANGITFEELEGFSKDFNSDRANLIAANAAQKTSLLEVATDYRGVRSIPNSFSIDLKTGKITDQKSSGRCWIFSALNTFRYEVMKKFNLENFEFSQNYIFFYDKLEKANYFLESVLLTLDEPVDGRLYSFLNSGGAGAQLAKVFQATIGSAGRTLFAGKYTVQSKAGWECGAGDDAVTYDPDAYIPEWLTDGDPFNDECAANDAGIVYTGSGPYLYVIFTDIPFGVFEQNTPANPLIPLLGAMHNAQCSMHNEGVR